MSPIAMEIWLFFVCGALLLRIMSDDATGRQGTPRSGHRWSAQAWATRQPCRRGTRVQNCGQRAATSSGSPWSPGCVLSRTRRRQ
eukprot:6396314-Lingulodinium_polyedra.AAC.1